MWLCGWLFGCVVVFVAWSVGLRIPLFIRLMDCQLVCWCVGICELYSWIDGSNVHSCDYLFICFVFVCLHLRIGHFE